MSAGTHSPKVAKKGSSSPVQPSISRSPRQARRGTASPDLFRVLAAPSWVHRRRDRTQRGRPGRRRRQAPWRRRQAGSGSRAWVTLLQSSRGPIAPRTASVAAGSRYRATPPLSRARGPYRRPSSWCLMTSTVKGHSSTPGSHPRRFTDANVVTAASRHDATTEVAHAIAAVLRSADIDVDERRPEEVGDLAPTTASCWALRSTPVIG